MKKLFLLWAIMVVHSNVFAQLSTNEQPISFNTNLKFTKETRSSASVVTMPQLNVKKLEAEDREDEEYDMPPRFGFPHKVNYNLSNSGIWKTLPNGDKLWQLNVICPKALSVNFCYDKFWIPEGGKFFVYSKDRKHSIGAFTSKNNKGGRNDVRGFATGLVYGNDVILEYYQPKDATTDAIISIEYIVHGYKYINLGEKSLGEAASCMVNVNCEEGRDWQNEKKAVAMILVNGHRYCTGSLINTTSLNQEPLFLTANHCISNYGDADGNSNLDFYSFYWNYEAPGCENISVEPAILSTSGATILANDIYSDFALLRLIEDPQNLIGYIPFYLGWDCSGQSGETGVCIHHPKGDVKKISTVADQPESHYSYNADLKWAVRWRSTENGRGITQGGSSGSPLLNAKHRVIGQLYGSSYYNCNDYEGYSWYGKFNYSWTGYNTNSDYRRLNCWLDSLNTGVQTMEGLLVISTDSTMTTNHDLYGNVRISESGRLTIQSNVSLQGNSCVIVESGGKLVIDGGTLSNVNLILKIGSSLRIINNGTLDTKNGFDAPKGATVDIQYGQIL